MQIGPTAERGHGLDAWVALGRQQADARTVRNARRADRMRIGGRVRQCPIDHRPDVFHPVRPGDIDLPGRIPKTARGVADHHVAVAGQRSRTAQIFQIRQRPTGRHHDQRKRPGTLPLRHQHQCAHLRTVPAGDAFLGLAEGARHRRSRCHPPRQCGDGPDPRFAHAAVSHAKPGRSGPAATAMHPLFEGERRERTRRYGMVQGPGFGIALSTGTRCSRIPDNERLSQRSVDSRAAAVAKGYRRRRAPPRRAWRQSGRCASRPPRRTPLPAPPQRDAAARR